jgi:hypothetical protein
MSKYEGVVKMLKDTCTQLTDADLDKVVTVGHENEKQAAIRWGIWLTIAAIIRLKLISLESGIMKILCQIKAENVQK